MRVGEVMTRGVRVANPDQTIGEAARLMAEIDAGALPVGEDEDVADVAQNVAEISTPGGAHSRRGRSKKKNARPL